jgi:tetratricopeptide (TPR) repeat protein
VDEQATADHIAAEGLWLPVLRPADERWLDLALVVDTAPSMLVWQRTVTELRTVLERLGAFRCLRVYSLDASGATPLVLHPSLTIRGPGLAPTGLVAPSRRQLVLLVTDGVGLAWRDGRMQRLLGAWARHSPVAIVTVLPQRMWSGTGLRVQAGRLRAARPGTPSSRYDTGGPPTDLTVPVVGLSARWLTRWAPLILGNGVWCNTPLLSQTPLAPVRNHPNTTVGPATDLVRGFRAVASPTAFRLACYLSAAWLNLPVMRMVQHLMLPESDTAHLAEVFLSGLLLRLDDPDDPETAQYDFRPGVREELNNYLLRDELLTVLQRSSQFVTERFGQPLDFAALLADPEGAELPAITGDATGRPLAHVAASVLSRLGGRYTALATRLASHSDPTSATSSPTRTTPAPSQSRPTEPGRPPRPPAEGAPLGSSTGVPEPLTGSRGIAFAGGHTVTIHQLPSPPPAWPVQVGRIPVLASAFQDRPGLRDRIQTARARAGGVGVVLTQVLSGGGGVGKSQLAAFYAVQALRDGTDLVVWVDASAPGGLVAAYAQAAARVQAPGASGQPADAETDAQAFLEWVQGTHRSWLVVLDDVTDPEATARWWPVSHTGTGWVLATTRRRDEVLFGGGRRRVDVDVYEQKEATDYLTQRLTDAGKPHLLDHRAAALAEALGRLPLALSHAAAYMITQRVTCGAYLDLYTAGVERLDELMPGDPDGHARRPDGTTTPVTVTLLLALDAADTCDPVGLARPAMDLAAVLDPAGHPETFWATPAITTYLTTGRTPTSHRSRTAQVPVTAGQARAAVLLLDRYGLVTLNEQAGPRGVRVHPLTARTVREITLADSMPRIARVAADALLALWPDGDHLDRDLAVVLRANTDVLYTHAGDALWHPNPHPLLWRAGHSLLQAGQHTAAITHWQHTSATAQRILGPEHPDTLTARANVASSYRQAGRTAEAITLLEEVAAQTVRLLGPEHPDTLTAQANLASSYRQAGRTAEAITLLEEVAAQTVRLLGPEHPDTLTAQANLASSYRQAGRTAEAITLLEEVAAQTVRLLGPEHPDTLTAQANLASSYRQAGRTAEAITLLEEVAAQTVRLLGPEHPDTLTAQANLASSYRQAGRTAEAITLLEEVAAQTVRLLGPEHPDTLTAQANLASSYRQAGRTAEAITLLEEVAAQTVRLLGPEHPDTLTAQANLASSYRQAGRTAEAITLLEEVAAQTVRLLGPEHPDTLTAQANLASSYRQAGRTAEAITLLEEVAAQTVRLLGPEHPDTLTAQANLASSYRQAGRTAEAITLLEEVAAQTVRLLGPEHPDTLAVADALRECGARVSDSASTPVDDGASDTGVPYENTADPVWGRRVLELYQRRELQVQVFASEGVVSTLVWGACPRCGHALDVQQTLSVPIADLRGGLRGALAGWAPRDRAWIPKTVEVTCGCLHSHPDAPKDVLGCGLSFLLPITPPSTGGASTGWV